MYLHLKTVNASDYFERRDRPYPSNLRAARYGATNRLAHINMYLDSRANVRAAGPVPDGTSAEVIYQFASMGELKQFLEHDPYVIGGVWRSWSIRPMVECVYAPTPIPVCMDGTRHITIVEEAGADRGSVASALRQLQQDGALAIGGITEDDTAMAWICAPDHNEALRLWTGVGMNRSGQASCRSLIWVM